MRGRTTQNVVSSTAKLAAERSSWTTTPTLWRSSRKATESTLPITTSL
jgi:hypothetical protein